MSTDDHDLADECASIANLLHSESLHLLDVGDIVVLATGEAPEGSKFYKNYTSADDSKKPPRLSATETVKNAPSENNQNNNNGNTNNNGNNNGNNKNNDDNNNQNSSTKKTSEQKSQQFREVPSRGGSTGFVQVVSPSTKSTSQSSPPSQVTTMCQVLLKQGTCAGEANGTCKYSHTVCFSQVRSTDGHCDHRDSCKFNHFELIKALNNYRDSHPSVYNAPPLPKSAPTSSSSSASPSLARKPTQVINKKEENELLQALKKQNDKNEALRKRIESKTAHYCEKSGADLQMLLAHRHGKDTFPTTLSPMLTLTHTVEQRCSV